MWIDYDLQKGREIQKTRPALVLSTQKYNEQTSLALFVTISSKIKGYPFEVALDTKSTKGVIFCDQVSSLDWKARKAKFIIKAPPNIIPAVLSKLNLLLN